MESGSDFIFSIHANTSKKIHILTMSRSHLNLLIILISRIIMMVIPREREIHRRQCKMSSFKKNQNWPVKGLCCRCLSVWGLLPSYDPIPPPPYTLYMCLRVYSIIIHTGKGRMGGELNQREGEDGGRVEPERRLEGRQFTKLGRKYQHDWMYLQSINSD